MADKCNLSLEFDGPFLMHCILQCRANAFSNTITVSNSDEEGSSSAVEVVDRLSIGSSIYLCSSFLNHSCRPNVFCKFM
jgi:hypothetical protein